MGFQNVLVVFFLTLTCAIGAAQTEIVLDANGSEGTGRWRNASAATNQYGNRSYYARVGGAADSYTLATEPLAQGGEYRIYVWNSCYSPRANNVPHIIGSMSGSGSTILDTLYLDQDCATGISGQWEELGLYSFSAGAEAFVNISDSGLSSGSYIGVDAVRFVLESSQADTTPPIVSGGLPSGSTFPSGTTELSLSVATNEAALCRYSINPGADFSSMTTLQSTTSGLAHSSLVQGLQDGTSYQFYIKCLDNAMNVNGVDYNEIFFNIESPEPTDTTPPQLNAGQPSGTLFPSSTAQVTLTINTDEVASCAYSDVGGVAYENMFGFSSTSSVLHSTVLLGLESGQTYNVFIKCRDTSGNSNTSDYEEIFFSIDEAGGPVPQTEIIIDANGSDGTGRWRNASAATNQYGNRSYYATVGGAADSYTLATNPLAEAGEYRVYVWNSCYSPRANNVPHIIGSIIGGGSTVLDTKYIDQDCSTGISGQWEELGLYNFAAGAAAFVNISDSGLSSGSYIGVDAVRFVLQSSEPGEDTLPPVISNGFPSAAALSSGTSEQAISVVTNEEATCRYSMNSSSSFASMTNLQASNSGRDHTTLIQGLQDGTSYSFFIKCRDLALNVNIVDYNGVSFSVNSPGGTGPVSDDFSGTGALLGYTTTKPQVLPNVGRINGRYHAELTDNTGNQTLHFNQNQGRLDAKLVSFPFEYTARNIGIGTLANSQLAPNPPESRFMFAGVQVHSTNLSAANSAHVVVGHRGSKKFTVEGKNTVNGSSSVNDTGANTVPDGRADIRIVGNSDRSLTVYWQIPNFGSEANDNWQLYRGSGNLPGSTASFGSSVYIGLITYAWGTASVPFVGTCDRVELTGE